MQARAIPRGATPHLPGIRTRSRINALANRDHACRHRAEPQAALRPARPDARNHVTRRSTASRLSSARRAGAGWARRLVPPRRLPRWQYCCPRTKNTPSPGPSGRSTASSRPSSSVPPLCGSRKNFALMINRSPIETRHCSALFRVAGSRRSLLPPGWYPVCGCCLG